MDLVSSEGIEIPEGFAEREEGLPRTPEELKLFELWLRRKVAWLLVRSGA